MPEPFKNLFNVPMIKMMGMHLKRVEPSFDDARFIKHASTGLDDLELKQRSSQICAALEAVLPQGFPSACTILLDALHPDDDVDLSGTEMDERGIRGWGIMPMSEFVANKGLSHFDLSMNVLKTLTMRDSSEFAVRSFLLADTDRALTHFMAWAKSPNYHVRRLASEGSRPRLPWGQQLPMFVKNPAQVLAILDILKNDTHEYVRRSVANNLNDIAKDHPDLVADIAEQWLQGENDDRKRLVKHACRTLIKQGHAGAFSAFGYKPPQLRHVDLGITTPHVKLGGHLEFTIELIPNAKHTQALMIDFIIHHRKANGKTSPKVFKWKTLKLKSGQKGRFTKKHPIKPITTRKYYSGPHFLELQINGQVFCHEEFELEV